ncbi:hypothetical protein Airi01_005950 [Actinoallomurus iriomotensis]|uniref:Uncharacterized protein n=1 Tax=Actinoallomurus iriomotensis TaxID=478107 RepID=A0A9W6RB18_9ACTN|nr:hypothetical protein Airi01_005950 [Actinoallomurus iriomotensis]
MEEDFNSAPTAVILVRHRIWRWGSMAAEGSVPAPADGGLTADFDEATGSAKGVGWPFTDCSREGSRTAGG